MQVSFPQIQQFVGFLQQAGLLGGTLAVILAFYKEWLFLPSYVKELRAQNGELRGQLEKVVQDRDDWREIAHSQATASERAVSVISKRARGLG